MVLLSEKIAELFDVKVPAISKIKTKFYNLDAIIADGYRVNSKRATQFRIWATKVLQNIVLFKTNNLKVILAKKTIMKVIFAITVFLQRNTRTKKQIV